MDQLTTRQQLNDGTASWGDAVLKELRAAGPRRSGVLQQTLKRRMHLRNGVVNSVGFQLPRYIIYREKSAVRGHGGAKGSRWWTPKGWRKTNPKSLGKAGRGNSQQQPYFNPIIDRNLPRLIDVVEQAWGTAAIDKIKNIRIR